MSRGLTCDLFSWLSKPFLHSGSASRAKLRLLLRLQPCSDYFMIRITFLVLKTIYVKNSSSSTTFTPAQLCFRTRQTHTHFLEKLVRSTYLLGNISLEWRLCRWGCLLAGLSSMVKSKRVGFQVVYLLSSTCQLSSLPFSLCDFWWLWSNLTGHTQCTRSQISYPRICLQHVLCRHLYSLSELNTVEAAAASKHGVKNRWL